MTRDFGISPRLGPGLFVASLLLISACAQLSAEGSGLATSPLAVRAVDSIPLALDPAAKATLLSTGSFTSFSKGQPKVDLCPDVASRADITGSLGNAPSNIGIQTLVVALMPPSLRVRPDRTLRLYNLIHQFRTMEGIQYFSSTHNQVRTLFTASHVVKALGDRTPQGDPRYSSVEPAHEFLLEQDDSTFSKNLYAVTVKGHEGGAVELTMSNVERVWFGIIPVLRPGALKLTMVIQASADGEYLYFYGNVAISATMVFGMEEQVRTSFYNRMVALYHWYAHQASGA